MSTTTTEQPALLTLRQAAMLLGLSKRSMQRVIAANALEPVPVDGLSWPRYRRADIEALVEKGRAP